MFMKEDIAHSLHRVVPVLDVRKVRRGLESGIIPV